MRILVTGSDGYIGTLLAPMLCAKGYSVTGLDTGYYRDGQLYHHPADLLPSRINRDLRTISENDLYGYEAVVHLAELSNDPLSELNPEITYEINHRSSVRLALLCKKAGVRRFVYASSCSVYGAADADLLDEESPTDPQTVYARCKVMVEQDVSRLASPDFSPTFLRNATAFGASPSMRFDLVLNNLAGLAWTSGTIQMTSDGTPWRPLVHVLDICRAIELVLESPAEAVHNQILNIGSTTENYQVRQIAEIVSTGLPGCRLFCGASGSDSRSYRVSFQKIRRLIPSFECTWTAASGVQQLFDLFRRIDMNSEVFQFRCYTRLRQLAHLLKTGQIDARLFWSRP